MSFIWKIKVHDAYLCCTCPFLLVKVDPVTGMVVNIAELKQCMEVLTQEYAKMTLPMLCTI